MISRLRETASGQVDAPMHAELWVGILHSIPPVQAELSPDFRLPLYIVRSCTRRSLWELKSRTSDSATPGLCSCLVVRDLSSSKSNGGSRGAFPGSEPRYNDYCTPNQWRNWLHSPSVANTVRWDNVIRRDQPTLNDPTTLLLPTAFVHLEAEVPTSGCRTTLSQRCRTQIRVPDQS